MLNIRKYQRSSDRVNSKSHSQAHFASILKGFSEEFEINNYICNDVKHPPKKLQKKYSGYKSVVLEKKMWHFVSLSFGITTVNGINAANIAVRSKLGLQTP